MRRIFLEGLNYSRVTPQRFLFLLRIKKWLKASRIMFVRYVYYTLWCLTIGGIFIKRYSYFMVPYIAAENPDMSGRDAVTLSRRIMQGHKWECFILELSFLGWQILGLLTFGLFNVLYTNPYKTAVFTQYYEQIRAAALEKAIPGAELLNDTYLYEKPEPALIEEKYADVIAVMKKPADAAGGLTGWRAFFARNFGVLFFARAKEKQYESRQAAWIRFQELMDDADGSAYPVRLSPVPEDSRRRLVDSLNYMRCYSMWSLIVIYLGLAIFGWLWEVAMHLITYGTFVNRGALHVASNIWPGLRTYPYDSEPTSQTSCDRVLYSHCPLRFSGIYDLCFYGIYYRRKKMVGLQWIFSESEWKDLCRRAPGIRPGRHRRSLYSGAADR